MTSGVAGWLQALLLVVALAACHCPLGDYMAWVFSSDRHLRVERVAYRLVGVDPDADQRWPVYLRSLLAFSIVSLLAVYLVERAQHWLPFSLGRPGVSPALAWNTAVSFATNTNWQNYSGETTMGYAVQAGALAVQNFVSAAVGLAVVLALIRGFARNRTDRVGNFWVDLVRGTLRILLPLSVAAAVVLLAGGVVQNWAAPHLVHGLSGASQTLTGGPVASQEAIKELGTNGGGFYNANSAHPFENPNPVTNIVEIFLLLLIPAALPRTFGRLVGDRRQGYAVLAVMGLIWVASVAGVTFAERSPAGGALRAAGAAMEGKEVRFGVPGSALFAASTTLTSTGAVNSSHDSFTPLGGGILIVNMMLGEVAPGGVGSGLYGMLILAVVAVFIAGLMVGRTPEYLGKKIRGREIKLASLYILTTPALVLVGTAVTMAVPGGRAAMLNHGPHGLSEVLYAFTSMANNNGSAFAGLAGNTTYYNVAGGLVMLLGRFVPIVFVLALGGSLAGQQPVPVTAGTLPTHRLQFVGLLLGVVVIMVALTYFPAMALGPLAEGLRR